MLVNPNYPLHCVYFQFHIKKLTLVDSCPRNVMPQSSQSEVITRIKRTLFGSINVEVVVEVEVVEVEVVVVNVVEVLVEVVVGVDVVVVVEEVVKVVVEVEIVVDDVVMLLVVDV